MKKRRPITIAVIIVALVAAGGFFVLFLHAEDPRRNVLPVRNSGNIQMYIKNGLVPPTNKWFSSLAFKEPSDPVFAYPLAAKTTERGLEVSYPTVTPSAEVVTAPFKSELGLEFADTVQPTLAAYDDLSALIEFKKAGQSAGTMRLVQGSPAVYVSVAPNSKLQITGGSATAEHEYYRFMANGHNYGLHVIKGEFDGHTATAGGTMETRFTLFVLPDGTNEPSEAFIKAASTWVDGGMVAMKQNNGSAQTTFTLHTQGNQPALFALLPEQRGGSVGPELGTYQTLLGTQTVHALQQYSFSTAQPDLPTHLDISHISPEQRNQLMTTLADDAKAVQITADDTYGAGKSLYRLANLLDLAAQLHASQQDDLKAALSRELHAWFDQQGATVRDSKSFYYNDTLKGVIGQKPSFGSDEFNDHHFHYGYFIYAAATLARYDSDFAAENGPVVRELIDDIAEPQRSSSFFPYLRMFDQYAGHAWASGFAPFSDGNNQESSSEALNAWYAIYLWGQATHDDALQHLGQNLYTREAEFAKNHYLSVDLGVAGQTYRHTIVSLVWSAKLDYSTFFSAEPSAKLAIQLIPLNPAAQSYLQDSPAKIAARLNEAGMPSPALFKDYLVMYEGMSDQPAALRQAGNLANTDIDSANSRTYLYAWLYSLKR
jgi:endo-1,3(4)-beta-glucanase